MDDEVVVLDVQQSAYFSVNPTGAALWPLLEKGATRDALIEAVLAEFDVDHGTAEQDVDRFLEDLGRRGLLKGSG